ncbi:MAG: tRNA (N(6)-L-threonylcarbamoyladenosine(37)-C(2))-methylthiotransferase MtaB [Candidatus Cloacimonetes bacterium]|nr:tRNA (N(6)-L-threonylcarbamoyladenosine(37)-C(2))-methylthiotransferase MtaB [Candidatus Cloacimonadota bacterium]
MVRKTIAAITFGCKVNQYETACIVDDFINAGYQVVDYNEPADVYIINSCTVTNRTDYKSRNAIRKAIKRKEVNPSVKIVVTGCYAQRSYEEIKELGNIDLIIDNNSKGKILECINRMPRCNNWCVDANLDAFHFQDISKVTGFEELFTTSMIDRTRAFIKIQDGCDYFCAYCAVPFGRGNPRSREKENVLLQIEKLVENGYKEFVLGGINLGLYSRENKKDKYYLSHLLWDIEAIKGVKLIRLSSIEPQLFDDDLLDFFKESKKLCPHFHIPLQVGCDELLTKMGRKYSTADFREVIREIKQILPDVAIGIDVIVGLPGEKDDLFSKTHNFLTSLDFTYIHVFPYSKRPGTKAEKMNGHIHGKIIRERSKKLIELSRDKLQEYLDYIVKNNVGLRGIIEKKTKNYWTSLSDHYIRIYLKRNEFLKKKYLHFFPACKKFDGIEVKLSD